MSEQRDQDRTDGAAGAEQAEARLRRAPRIGVFLALGALLGVLGSLIATSVFPVDPAVGFAATFGYLLVYGIPAGLLLGASVALVIDAVASRRARTVTVERAAMHGEEPDGE